MRDKIRFILPLHGTFRPISRRGFDPQSGQTDDFKIGTLVATELDPAL